MLLKDILVVIILGIILGFVISYIIKEKKKGTKKEAAKTHKNFLIMGAGLVGIDCVSGLLSSGVNVTLVEMAGWMLSKQLDERAAKTYQDAFAAKGVAQYYGDGI